MQGKNVVFQFVYLFIEVVHHRQVVVHDAVDYGMQQERGAALTGNRARSHGLLYLVDTDKFFVMIGEDIVASEKAIQLDGIETVGTGVGPDRMHDEINIVGKLLDLWMMAVCAANFYRHGMKKKQVKQYVIIRLWRVFDVDPENDLLIL